METHWSEDDQKFMHAAIAEARIAASVGEVPVGSVVVRDGEIIGRGHNLTIQDTDPSAHAEVVALRAAARSVQNHRLVDVTLYVTLEPCAMCVGAMLQARISRLVFAAYDKKAGAAGTVLDLCDHRGFNHRIEVNGGLMQAQGAGMLQQFFEKRRG